MTYDDQESSTYLGQPQELYEFRNGELVWRFTSSDEAVVYLGEKFTPESIDRPPISESQEINKLALKLSVPSINPVAAMYQFYPPTSVTSVTIFRGHRGGEDTIVLWMGRILNVEILGESSEILCEPISTSIRRLGLRKYYQRQCPHALYGPSCGVNKESHKSTFVVSGRTGLTINVTGLLSVDQFAGGMVSWESAAGTQWRFVTGNTSNSLQINFPVLPDDDKYGRGLPVGSTLSVYPGCQHTLTDCINKFNNLPNYGGFPFIPMLNPFGLTSLW